MAALSLVLGMAVALPAEAQDALPRPDPTFNGVVGRTVKDSKPDFPKEVYAPKGAPNVLLIMTDDVGFGASSPFGGPIPTPTLDRLAQAGLRYNRVPHDRAVLADPRGADHRAQPSQRLHRRDHGNRPPATPATIP